MKNIDFEDQFVSNNTLQNANSDTDVISAVTFEMLRSFVELATTLNVSKTANLLGLTRQTVKRHVKLLETAKKLKLFNIKGKQYELTPDGKREVQSAELVLSQLDSWLIGETGTVNGLVHRQQPSLSEYFFQQQYPLQKVFSLAPPLLQRGLQAWLEAKTEIDHAKFRKIRPYMMVYRQFNDNWICVEAGDKSSYSTWFGLNQTRSMLGLSTTEVHPTAKFNKHLIEAYDLTATTGGAWYDHLHIRMPRQNSLEPVYVCYQRLVLALLFPNGEQVVGALIARTNNISIDGLILEKDKLLPPEDLMEFEI